jgi:hypothetical protein
MDLGADLRPSSVGGVQEIVIENIRSANCSARVGDAEEERERSRVVAAPVILPGLALRRRPGGSWPARSDHV